MCKSIGGAVVAQHDGIQTCGVVVDGLTKSDNGVHHASGGELQA